MRNHLFWFVTFLILFTFMAILMAPPTPMWRMCLFPIFFIVMWKRVRFDAAIDFLNEQKNAVRILCAIFILLILFRTGLMINRFIQPLHFIEDIASMNYDSILMWFQSGHVNPYSNHVFPFCIPERCFDGFIYPPLQIFTYAPATLMIGIKGVYLTHIPVYLGILYLIFWWLRRYSLLHAILGGTFWLATDPAFVLPFNNGTNDLLPTFFMTLSLICIRLQDPKKAGIVYGLSVLSKQLPGGLFIIPFLIQKQLRVLLIAGVVFAIVSAPFVFIQPMDFFNNVFLFMFKRPVRPSSAISIFSPEIQVLFQVFGVMVWVFLSYLGRKNARWSIQHSFTLPVIGICTFLIFAKMSPFHYFLWAIPVLVLWTVEPDHRRVAASSAT